MSVAREHWPLRLQLLAVPAAAAFAWHAGHHWRRGEPGQALWTCIVIDVVLAVGLALGLAPLVRTAALVHCFGLPLWLYESRQLGWWTWPSAATHVGCLAISLVALRRMRFARWTWPLAIAALLVTQEAARLWTDPALNVDLAHRMRPGWERWFSGYWQAWMAGVLLSATFFSGCECLLLAAYPPTNEERA